MSSAPSGEPRSGQHTTVAASGDERFLRFLRISHVLGSVLREILEDRFLREVSPLPLTRAQFCTLKLVALNAELQVGELARCLGVSAAATSKAIDRLERLGLARRAAVPGDRRAIALSASAKGYQLVRGYEELKASRVEPVVQSLTADEQDQLCELLERVCVGLLKDEPSRDGRCLRCAGYHQADCSVGPLCGGCALEGRQTLEGGVVRN